VALCVYRVAQEALTNVVRHAGARRVAVALVREADRLVLRVADDGRGLGPAGAEPVRGLGLRSAAERAEAVGGVLTVTSRPGAGTTVQVTVPLETAHA
jgi:signal transduction histidine kinase